MKFTIRRFDDIHGDDPECGYYTPSEHLSYQRKKNDKRQNSDATKEQQRENNNVSLDVLHDNSRTEVQIIEEKPKEFSDGGWGWLIVLSSMVIHLITMGLDRASGILLLRFEERYNKPVAVAAWVTSISASLTNGVGPIAVALSNRFSYRAIVLSGGIILCVSMIASGLSPNIYLLAISYGVMGGIGKAFAYGPGVVIVGNYFNKRRGLAVGLATSGVALGAFAIPSLVELSNTSYGFLGIFIMLAGVSLQLVVCGVLLRPVSLHKKILGFSERKKKETAEKNSYDNKVCADEESTNNLGHVYVISKDIDITCNGKTHEQCADKSQYSSSDCDKLDKRRQQKSSLLCNIHFIGFIFALLLYNFAYESCVSFLPAFSSKVGIENFEAFPVVVVSICDGLGRVLSGFIFDITCIKPYRYLLLNSAIFFLGVVTFILPHINDVIQLGVVCAIYGLFLGTGISQQSVVIVDIIGENNLSHGFGLLLLFKGIGTFIGPPLTGLLKDINGTYDYAFYFGGVVAVFGSFILLITSIIHKRHNRNMLR